MPTTGWGRDWDPLRPDLAQSDPSDGPTCRPQLDIADGVHDPWAPFVERLDYGLHGHDPVDDALLGVGEVLFPLCITIGEQAGELIGDVLLHVVEERLCVGIHGRRRRTRTSGGVLLEPRVVTVEGWWKIQDSV